MSIVGRLANVTISRKRKNHEEDQISAQMQASLDPDYEAVSSARKRSIMDYMATLDALKAEASRYPEYQWNMCEEAYTLTIRVIMLYLQENISDLRLAQFYYEAAKLCNCLRMHSLDGFDSSLGWLSDQALWMRMATIQAYRNKGPEHPLSRKFKNEYQEVLDELWQCAWLSDGGGLVGYTPEDYQQLIRTDKHQHTLCNGQTIKAIDFHMFAESSLVFLGRHSTQVDIVQRAFYVALAGSRIVVSKEDALKFLEEHGHSGQE